MWPWEHAVFAYVVYSLACRVARTTPETGKAVLVLAVASVMPDLIDKPLAWQWGVFENSFGIGHSVFFAIPMSLLAVGVGFRSGNSRIGIAFAVGYLSHLLGDLIPAYILDGEVPIARILWPIGDAGPPTEHVSLTEGIAAYMDLYLAELHSGDPSGYLLMQVVFLLVAIGLWIIDRTPGLPREH